jgi:signal transduction histidine kinase
MESQEQLIAILVYGIIFIVLLTTGLMFFFFYSRKKIIEKEFEKIELQLKNQEEILQATIDTQEEERKRIAQDMHDAISSKLNVISLTTNLLLDNNEIDPGDQKSLEHILAINNSVLESSRKIAHDLLPPILGKFGLKVALEELFDDYQNASKFQIMHRIDAIQCLSSMEELHLFRIVQELINNSIKHANASQLTIDLSQNSNDFELKFTDNGKGFKHDTIDIKAGIGLQNIKSRAAILNCNLSIESIENNGCAFVIKTK